MVVYFISPEKATKTPLPPCLRCTELELNFIAIFCSHFQYLRDCSRPECTFSVAPDSHNGAMGAHRFHQLFAQVVSDETTKLPALEPLQVRIIPSKRFWA
jgi:hypothetical protein